MKTVLFSRTRTFRTLGAVLIALFLFVICISLASCKTGVTMNDRHASVTEDFKTDYFVGESLVVSGDLKIFYDSTTFDLVPITEDMISDFDTSLPGDVIVKVTYGDFVASIPIRVHPINAVSLSIDEGTFPTVIYEGTPFPSGATMTVTLTNGETLRSVPVTASMLGGFDSAVLGPQTVTVGYLGASVPVGITIKQDVLVSISLVNAKSNYAVGEALSLSGVSLNLSYESGKVANATLSQNWVADFDTSLGGSFTAKVRYDSLECDYPYTVTKAALSIAFAQDSLPAVFEKGDAFPTTGRATVVYDDGTSEVISLTTENVPAFSTATAGAKHVEVVVPGVSDGYDYTVLPEITSATPYGYTAAVMQGTAFDGLGELIVVYETGDRESIALSSDRLSITYATNEVGDIEQAIGFRRGRYPFSVHVYDESEREAVESIDLAGVFRPVKRGDQLDVTGVQVNIIYKYLSSRIENCQPTWASVTMPDMIEGDYVDLPVTVTCFGVSAESTVRVLSETYAERVTSLSVSGLPSLYVVGDELSLQNVTLYAVLGGGYSSRADIAADASYFTGFDTSSPGEKELTVTYEGATTTLSYRVITETDKTCVTGITVTGFAPLLFAGDDLSAIDVSKYTLSLTMGYGYATDSCPLTAEMLTGGPFEEPGFAEVTVTYQGVQKVLGVTVRDPSEKTKVTSIRVPDTIYSYVGTMPDLSAIDLEVTYGYGYSTERIPLTHQGVTVASFSTATAGITRVPVSYEGCECGAFISFASGDSDNVLESVEISSGTRRTFEVGDPLSDVVLIAVYRGGRRQSVTVTMEMAPDFSTESAGEHTITIAYHDKAAVFNYTVTGA